MTTGAHRPSALTALESFSALLGARRPAVFLDYDGTLTPIVPRPQDAHLDPPVRAAIGRLAGRVPVAIVSGRDREDVVERVGLEGLYYAGSHGFDVTGPDGSHLEFPGARAALPTLDAAERELGEVLAGVPGTQLERKRFSLAVHYRHCAEADVPRVREQIERWLTGGSALRVTSGKKVFDLQPDVEWDKGRAVGWILEQLGLDGPDGLPIYLGDDVTDEDAFRALQGRGFTVFVGPSDRDTAAAYRLADPGEVARFLERLAAVL